MAFRGRRVLAIAVAAAALATMQLPALARAKPVPGITMRPLVTRTKARYLWVVYHSKKYSTVRAKGTVTGASAGMLLQFYADEFPYTSGWQPIAHRILPHNGTDHYNFTATPTLATKYRLELFQNSSATTPLLTTKSSTVYVLANYHHSSVRKCGHPICRQSIRISVTVPPVTLTTEVTKRVYGYFNYTLATDGVPSVPKWLYRDIGHLRLTRSRKATAIQFDYKFSFWFRTNNDHPRWIGDTCSKDTERIDGLNLPGHHGCGNRRVFATSYVG